MYKRQLVRSAGDDMMEHLIVGLVRMENGELDAQLLFTEGPVSYTHLDVYKRQPSSRTVNALSLVKSTTAYRG